MRSGPRPKLVCILISEVAGSAACAVINDIPDCDRYVHHENRPLIQSLALMRLAITTSTLSYKIVVRLHLEYSRSPQIVDLLR